MRVIRTSKNLCGSPEMIWNVITDFQSLGWRGDLASIQVSHTEESRTVTETLLDGTSIRFLITQWEPNEAYQHTMKGDLVSRSWGVYLAPVEAGKTKVTICEEYHFKHKWMDLASYFYLPVKEGQKQYLKQLASHLKELQYAKI